MPYFLYYNGSTYFMVSTLETMKDDVCRFSVEQKQRIRFLSNKSVALLLKCVWQLPKNCMLKVAIKLSDLQNNETLYYCFLKNKRQYGFQITFHISITLFYYAHLTESYESTHIKYYETINHLKMEKPICRILYAYSSGILWLNAGKTANKHVATSHYRPVCTSCLSSGFPILILDSFSLSVRFNFLLSVVNFRFFVLSSLECLVSSLLTYQDNNRIEVIAFLLFNSNSIIYI